MDVLSTDEGCFTGFKYYASKHDVQLGLRRYSVHRSEFNAGVVLMLHGEPNRHFRYRLMIPAMSKAGLRVFAADLLSLGRPYMPDEIKDYSFASQVKWVLELIRALDLQNITLVLQEKGALLGLRLAAEYPHLFSRIILTNEGLSDDLGLVQMFRVWKLVSTKWRQVYPSMHNHEFCSPHKLTEREVAACNTLLFQMSLLKWQTV